MGVRNGSLTEGDGKEHLSSSQSSVCRSSWPWFCQMCAVGCLNVAGVIDSWRRIATVVRFAVDRTALSSGELDIRNSPKFFEDVLFVSDCTVMDLPTEGFEHGRWTRLPKESRRYGETWTGSASAVMVKVHARTHAHREHADVPSTSGKSFFRSRQTPSTCPNTEKKEDSGMGEIISRDCSSSHHSQCEFVAQTARVAVKQKRT